MRSRFKNRTITFLLICQFIGIPLVYASSIKIDHDSTSTIYELSKSLTESKTIENFLVTTSIEPKSFIVTSKIDLKFKELLLNKIIEDKLFHQFISLNPCLERPYNKNQCIKSKIELFFTQAKITYALDEIVVDFFTKDLEYFELVDNKFKWNSYYYEVPSKEEHLLNLLMLRYILSTNIQTNIRLKNIALLYPDFSPLEHYYLDRFNKMLINLTEDKIKLPQFRKLFTTEFVALQLENVRLGNSIGLLNPIKDLTDPLKIYFNSLSHPTYYVTNSRPLEHELFSMAKSAMNILSSLESDLNKLIVKMQNNESEESEDFKKIILLKEKSQSKIKTLMQMSDQISRKIENKNDNLLIENFVNDFHEAVSDFSNLTHEVSSSSKDNLEFIDVDRALTHIENLSYRLWELSKSNKTTMELTSNDFHNLAFNNLLSEIYVSATKSGTFGIPAKLGFSLALVHHYNEISTDEIHFIIRQPLVLMPKKKQFKNIMNVFLSLIIPPLSIVDQTKISPILLNVISNIINQPKAEEKNHGLIPLNKEVR